MVKLQTKIMDIILLLGIIIFSISAGYFSVFNKKTFNTAFLVSAITLVSYIIMYSGILVTTNSSGDALYWTRWIGYSLSCSLLVYTMAKKLDFKSEKIASTISLNIFVMLSGAIASILTGWYMIGVYLISSFAYVLMVKPIISNPKSDNIIKSIVLGGWGVFPIVFLLSHEGFGVIENNIAFGAYILLDIFTKIIYYFIKKD